MWPLFIQNIQSHCGKSFSKATVILRLSFGYPSIVPGWEKWAYFCDLSSWCGADRTLIVWLNI